MDICDLAVEETAHSLAVIDIGSNSVRLVIYDAKGRAPTVVFNEKILCGLGRGLTHTGRLSDEGFACCLKVMPRFARLARDGGVDEIYCIATAAVREAENGQNLIEQIRNICGIETEILSGTEEARLSALGVLSGCPSAEGLVGDLGGGSVELVTVGAGAPGNQASLPLGPLRQWEMIQRDRHDCVNLIDKYFNNLKWLDDVFNKSLYVVGGAWRTLAKLHMEYVDYPLHVIHHYEIPVREALDFTAFLSNLSSQTLHNIKGVSSRRVETLPYAALLLNRLLQRTAPKHLVFSSCSIREGCLFDRLSPDMRKKDPLIEASRKAQRIRVANPIRGERLEKWIAPAFSHFENRQRLRLAACHISDVGRGEHPDYRADHAMMRVLRYPYVAITHAERAFVALAVATRYGNTLRGKRSLQSIEKLLNQEEQREAKAIGRAIRLAYNLSGGVACALSRFELRRDGDLLTLSCAAKDIFMIGEIAEKRLNSLCQLLNCRWKIQSDKS